jgi:hypothetical protein
VDRKSRIAALTALAAANGNRQQAHKASPRTAERREASMIGD